MSVPDPSTATERPGTFNVPGIVAALVIASLLALVALTTL